MHLHWQRMSRLWVDSASGMETSKLHWLSVLTQYHHKERKEKFQAYLTQNVVAKRDGCLQYLIQNTKQKAWMNPIWSNSENISESSTYKYAARPYLNIKWCVSPVLNRSTNIACRFWAVQTQRNILANPRYTVASFVNIVSRWLNIDSGEQFVLVELSIQLLPTVIRSSTGKRAIRCSAE